MPDENYHQEGFVFPTEEPTGVPDEHPLRNLFNSLIDGAFLNTVGCYDSSVTEYLAGVLTDFTHMRRVYKVQSLGGTTITEVADMIVEADIRLNATSFNREREVHKHIGDFTIFWTGLYPESLPKLLEKSRKDQLIDYIEQGKTSYAIAAAHDYGAYRDQAKVLKKLSEDFEVCLHGLQAVRTRLGQLQQSV